MKETQQIEFKSGFNEEVIETLVAFANSKGGRVLVGVDDDGNPTGKITIGKESVQKWLNEIKTKTQPSIVPDIEMIDYNGNEAVEFKITEYPVKPVAVKGRYYKRINNSTHRLSLNEIVNLHIQTFNSSWDYYPDPNHDVLDISEDKALRLIAMYNKNRTIPVERDVFEFLTKMELIRDGKLTNAGFLLLMKNDSIVSDIDLGHFQNEITIKDGISVYTDLITETEEVMAFVRKHISKEFIITANPAHIERWDYPLDAIREIVLNMIVHRDYMHYGSSSVKIFPDRIEFFNPGRLPDQISIDDLLSNSYASVCRNKQIARIFKEIEWIEHYGTGIRRIRDYFREYGSPEPVFENFQHGFRVTAYALNAKSTERGREKVGERITVIQGKISGDTEAYTEQKTDASSEELTGQVSSKYPASTPQVSCEYPACTLQVSCEHPASTPQVSGEYPASTPQVSGEHPASILQVSGESPASTPQVSGESPASTLQVSGEYSASTPQVFGEHPASTLQVEALIKAIDGDMNRMELQKLLNLTDRENFRIMYLQPALREGLVELVYADSPNHPRQKYRLTEKGREIKKSRNFD